MVACLALSVLVCSSAHNAFWRFTVLVLGTSGVRRLLAPGRGGVLALGVSDSRLSPTPMALGAPPLNDRLAAQVSARQPGHSATLRCSILYDCSSSWPLIGRSDFHARLLWLAVFWCVVALHAPRSFWRSASLALSHSGAQPGGLWMSTALRLQRFA